MSLPSDPVPITRKTPVAAGEPVAAVCQGKWGQLQDVGRDECFPRTYAWGRYANDKEGHRNS